MNFVKLVSSRKWGSSGQSIEGKGHEYLRDRSVVCRTVASLELDKMLGCRGWYFYRLF